MAKDHFVSKFLLKRFAIHPTGIKSGLIFVYQKPNYVFEEKSIQKHAANDVDFYEGKDRLTKMAQKYVDEFYYKIIENKKNAPAVISKLLIQKDKIDLNYKERCILATLIAHQYTRTKKFRYVINKFISYLLLHELIQASDLEDIDKMEEIFVRNKFNLSVNQVFSDKLIDGVVLGGIRGQELMIPILIAEYLEKEIVKKNLHIIEPTNEYFIISDNPICILGRKEEMLGLKNFWNFKHDDNYALILPISPKKAVVFGNNYRESGIIKDKKVSDSLTIMINSISFNNLHEEFYSNANTFKNDYKDKLITPDHISIHFKINEELNKNLLKKLWFLSKYYFWKLKKGAENLKIKKSSRFSLRNN